MSGQGSSADELKEAAARRAVELVRDGMIVGLGTGSTAALAVRALGERVTAGLRMVGVATSRQTEAQARALDIPIADLDTVERIDLTIDGADEIDLATFNLIKGRGGALLREKLVAIGTTREVIIADESKLVARLGASQPVPVEVVQFGWGRTARALAGLGLTPARREIAGEPYTTDNGNYILDCASAGLADPPAIAMAIKVLPGVVEHGLFIGLTHTIIVAGAAGPRQYERGEYGDRH